MNSKSEVVLNTPDIPLPESRPRIAEVFEAHRGEQHVVVMQDYPDPDAISSAHAHCLISAEFDIGVDIIYSGKISHQQNIALVKLLGLNLIQFDPSLDLRCYQGAVFVDNQGTTCESVVQTLQAAQIPILMVIDHHELQERLKPEFSDIYRTGATATIYTQYLEQGLVQLDKLRKEHVIAATALMHGIISDTNNFIGAKAEDFHAAAFLSQFRDADLLGHIMNQARSKQVMEVIRRALGGRTVVEGFSMAGIGYLRAEDRDAVPQAADFLLTEENVHTAIVYGIVTGSDQREKMEGSLRTTRVTFDPDAFLKETLGKDESGRYFGGGKALAGGFEIPIGFLSGSPSDQYRDLKWQVYHDQIKQKLFAKIGVETN